MKKENEMPIDIFNTTDDFEFSTSADTREIIIAVNELQMIVDAIKNQLSIANNAQLSFMCSMLIDVINDDESECHNLTA